MPNLSQFFCIPEIFFSICVLVLLIPKGCIVVRILLLNVRIKALGIQIKIITRYRVP